MNKPKLKVVTNKYTNQACVTFLKEEFEVETFVYEELIQNKRSIPRDLDVLLLTGGADVNPDMYAERLGKFTSIDKTRDRYEADMFSFMRRFGVLTLGICRGAQLATVLSGGRLIQHVEGHGAEHEIVVPMYGTSVIATSTHHQMMYPYELREHQYDLLGWSKYFRSTTYLDGRNEEFELNSEFLEPEIVYYNNTRSLAIQGHPEFDSANPNYKGICLGILKNCLSRKERID